MRQRDIVVFYAWGKNAPGDHALGLGALTLLSELVPPERITIVSRYSRRDIDDDATEEIQQLFPGVEVVPAPFGLSREDRWSRYIELLMGMLVVLLCMAMPRLSIRILKRSPSLQRLKDAKIVLLNSGNLLYWHRHRRSLPRLAAFAFPLLLARRLGIPYGILPQTSGPFEGTVGRKLCRLFEWARFTSFRDSQSQMAVRQIVALPDESSAVVPDVAFFLWKSQRCGGSVLERFGLKSGEFIPITLRVSPLEGLAAEKGRGSTEATKRLLEFFPCILDRIRMDLHKTPVLMIQAKDDIRVSNLLQQEYRATRGIEIPVLELSRPMEFVALYSQAFLLIGMRLHMMIFGLSQAIPALGLWRKGLGMKIPGMFADFGLREFVFELDSVSPKDFGDALITLASRRDSLQASLRAHLNTELAKEIEFFRRWIGAALDA